MKAFLPLLLALLTGQAFAQGLPPPSRTVYKCEDGKQVHYSDSPCLGARKIDVEPTRGLDKSSGQKRQGQDVQKEHQQEAFADALRPLTGMDAPQLDKAGRRQRLSPQAQQQCRIWDQQLPAAEAAERTARTGAELATAQQTLFKLRTAYRKTGCD